MFTTAGLFLREISSSQPMEVDECKQRNKITVHTDFKNIRIKMSKKKSNTIYTIHTYYINNNTIIIQLLNKHTYK